MPLPPVLRGIGTAPDEEIRQGLEITGHFLTHWLAASLGDKPLPPARQRLISVLQG